jgi:SAM-dependent methyltransferase
MRPDQRYVKTFQPESIGSVKKEDNMKTLGDTEDSTGYWKRLAEEYIESLKGDYHTHRLSVIRKLIPADLYEKGKKVFDFGCGDGIMIPEFIKAGVRIEAADPSEEMVTTARKRVGSELITLAGVDHLKKIESLSLDGLLCLNVMCYFTDEEEKTFYEEARRIVKPGGYLVVTHSNELFDMFSLNKHTEKFFKKYLLTDTGDISGLLNYKESDNDIDYNVRENPITYKDKLKEYGFKEIKQSFSNRHPLPPSMIKEKNYPDTLNVPEKDKWTLMFTCSTYGSCSVKE